MKNLSHAANVLALAILLMLSASNLKAATITANAPGGQWGIGATWVGGIVPGPADSVIIGNGASVSIGIAAECLSLTINSGNQSSSLVINGTNSLTVYHIITIKQTTTDGAFKTLNVGDGTLTCVDFTMATTANDLRISQLLINTGTVTVNGNVTMVNAVRNKILFSGDGILNLKGSISGGSINPGTTNCIVYYNGTTPQTVNMAAAYVYKNLYLDNPTTTTLSAPITATKLTGDLKVLQGIFNNNGKAIAGDGAKTFEVADGATFQVQVAAFPTGFGTITLGATSTVEYNEAGPQPVADIAAPGYGNLILSGTGNKNANTGDGLDIRGNLTLNSGINFVTGTTAFTHNLAGNWINNGATRTGNSTTNFNGTSAQVIGGTATTSFYKVIIANSNGVSLNVGFTSITNTLTINTGCKLTIPANTQLTTGAITNNAGAAGLVIESNASGTGSLINTNANVQATVQRYITGWGTATQGWHFLSSPIASQAISGVWTPSGASGDYDFYLWDEPSTLWVNFKNTSTPPLFTVVNPGTNFVIGRGYMVSYEQTGTRAFTGAINVGNVTKSGLTNNSSASYSWNLLGNPYPCALSWLNGWSTTNIGGVCQIWSDAMASYVSLTFGENIPAMNGFMVEALSPSGGSVTIPNTARTHSTTAWYKNTATSDMIKLTAWEEGKQTGKESKIMWNPASTAGFDPDYDGHYLPDYAPIFYSLAGDEHLSVNTLPELGGTIKIPLVFAKNTASNFTIELDTENAIPDLTIYLTDNKTGAEVNLSENPVYQFSSADGDDINRFVISFLSTTGVTPVKENISVQVYASDNILHINQSEVQSGKVNLFSITGQLINTYSLEASPSQSISLPQLTPGIYMVNIRTSLGSYTHKVVIR